MNNKEFDNFLKKELNNEDQIPTKINQLFSDFENNIDMKEKKTTINLANILKTISALTSIAAMTFFGGCAYAHVNGVETIISPFLNKIGINSKYEENAEVFDNQVTKKDITVKLKDGALDDVSLIVGYEINIANNNPDNWLEINGVYKINEISIQPITTSIEKTNDTTYIYYQVFDINEIDLKDNDKCNLEMEIYSIREYTEAEDLDSSFAVYGDTFEDGWKFNESINVNNVQDSKEYEFTDDNEVEVLDGVYVSVTDFITGSYTNYLKIKTDKTNYKGNSFEKYYQILDENSNEIGRYSEEVRQYDNREYKDRLPISNISKKSRIYIEVYIKVIDDEEFKRVATIPVDLSKITEKVKENAGNIEFTEYKNDKYSFKYNKNWKLTPSLDESVTGPYSIYKGALSLEIPSTTNDESGSSISVKTFDKDISLEEYKKEIQKENTASVSEYFDEISTSEISFKNAKGYQITSQISDGETIYIKKDFITIYNGIGYRIIFDGSEKEFNNMTSVIDNFVENFEIIK